MKKFFVKHGKHANQYSLAYTETAEQTQCAEKSGWERITRREAVRLAVREAERREYLPESAGYADSAVYPFGYTYGEKIAEDSRYEMKARIWEARK